jgi:hypothetical protein
VVEGAVRVGAVAVLLAVAEVVLDVVGDEVTQGEPVVRRDEVDARERAALGVNVFDEPARRREAADPAGTTRAA